MLSLLNIENLIVKIWGSVIKAQSVHAYIVTNCHRNANFFVMTLNKYAFIRFFSTSFVLFYICVLIYAVWCLFKCVKFVALTFPSFFFVVVIFICLCFDFLSCHLRLLYKIWLSKQIFDKKYRNVSFMKSV